MAKTILNFLKVSLSITIIVLLISVYFLFFEANLDAESVMSALLLASFTAFGAIIQGLIYYLLSSRTD